MNTTSELRSKIERLVDSGQKPSYLTKFIYCEPKGSKTGGYCPEHDVHFITATRNLTHPCRTGNTCPFCMREAGEINFISWPDLKSMISESDWPFEVANPSQFSEKDFFNRRYGGLASTTKIDVVCTKNCSHSSHRCATQTSHSFQNIQYALTHPDHLLCQGLCDSKRKGKARRKPFEAFKKELDERYHGEWRITLPDQYIKKSENILLTHECGHSRMVAPSQALNPNVNLDCGVCSGHSIFNMIVDDIDELKTWVEKITEGKTCLIQSYFPKSRKNWQCHCNVCESDYTADEEQLRSLSRGCKQCEKDHASRERAWKIEEAQALMQSREFELKDDPQSYTVPASLVSLKTGESLSQSILSILQSHPVSHTPVSKPHGLSVSKDIKRYQRYTQEELTLIQSLLNKYSYKEIAQHLGRSEGTIKSVCRQHGWRNDQRENSNREKYVNDSAFSVVNEASAFFAGLIATDGHIRANSNSITLELKAVDETLMYELMKFIDCDCRLSYRTMCTVDGRGVYAALHFSSAQIVKDLQTNFGIDKDKTMNFSPKLSINDPNAWAFFAGMMAGDGHIRIDRTKGSTMSFVSASFNSIEWAKALLKPIVGDIKTHGEDTNKSFLQLQGARALEVFKKLKEYDFSMHRKWAVIRKAIEEDIKN